MPFRNRNHALLLSLGEFLLHDQDPSLLLAVAIIVVLGSNLFLLFLEVLNLVTANNFCKQALELTIEVKVDALHC